MAMSGVHLLCTAGKNEKSPASFEFNGQQLVEGEIIKNQRTAESFDNCDQFRSTEPSI